MLTLNPIVTIQPNIGMSQIIFRISEGANRHNGTCNPYFVE